jgi:hypothetical protein
VPGSKRSSLLDRLSSVSVVIVFAVMIATLAFMFALGLGLVWVPVGH